MPATPAFSKPSFSPLQGAGHDRTATGAGSANRDAADWGAAKGDSS